jgi:hypothetical protein
MRINMKENTKFLEVVSTQDKEESTKGGLEEDLKQLQRKTNFSENSDSNSAVKAAISYLQNEKAKND